MDRSQSSTGAVPLIAVVGSAALLATFAWTHSDTSMWSAVATTPVAAQTAARIPINVMRHGIPSLPASNQPVVHEARYVLPSPTMSNNTWSMPAFGVLSMMVGAMAGYLLQVRLRPESAHLLQPLAMLGATATSNMKSASEAEALWRQEGYSILDIRSDFEGAEGRIRTNNKGTIDIPLINAKSAYDSAAGKKVVTQQVNKQWLDQVKAKFSKDAKIVVMCSDGRNRTAQALDLLAAEGYRNVVGMDGGFNKWDQIYDRQMRKRSSAQQAAKAASLMDPVDWTRYSGGAAAPRPAASASSSASVAPVQGSFTDSSFQSSTIAAFPAKANATVEEARVLWSQGGYSILDIRSEMEGREGRIRGPNKGSIDIPLFNAKSAYDSTLGKKVVTQEANRAWLDDVKSRFAKDAKIIVMCSDGTTRSNQAVDLLASEGFKNVVLLRGGYNRWDQVFDKSLAVRSAAQQAQKAEWLDDPVEWGNWFSASGTKAPATRAVAPAAAPAARTTRSTVALGAFQDPAFQAATIAAFPAKANATIEEARVLWKLDGYSILDIRSEMEGRDGRIRGPNKGSIDIPMFNAKSAYDSTLGKKVVTQEANRAWLNDVKARFAKDAKIIVVCSDGTTRSSQALDLLAAEGYKNLVLMRGGYNRWDQVFDKGLGLRSPAQQAAKAEWLDDHVAWGSWTGAVGVKAPATRAVPQSAAPATRTVRTTQAMGSFQDPAFQAATVAAFPAKGSATIEESRVLWKLDGYSILDIRSEMEGAEGRIRGPNKGSIDIPLFSAKSMYDSSLGKKVVKVESNPKFLDLVKARFPKDTKLVLMCSDGTSRSAQALKLLQSAGYNKVVVMTGGFNKWDQMFDRSLAVRPAAAQQSRAAALKDTVQWK